MANNIPFILSDESINSYGLIIETSGIDTTNFTSNPIMPFNHNINVILGNWTDLKKDNDKLTATAVFDEDDPESVKIMKKVEKGLIKGTSIGININKYELSEDEDVILITSSELMEASITPLPSNKNALKLTYKNKEFVMNEDKTKEELKVFLSGDNEETNEALEELKSTETEDVQDVDESKEVEPKNTEEEVATEEVKVEAEGISNEEASKEEEVEKSVIDELKLNYELETDEALVNKFKSLNSDLELKENDILTLKTKVSDLEAKVSEFEKNDRLELIDNAIKTGKFTKDQRATLIKLSENDFDSLKSLIDNAQSKLKPGISLTEKISDKTSDNKRQNWTIRDWEKNDSKGLKELKASNEALYNQMYDDYYNKKK